MPNKQQIIEELEKSLAAEIEAKVQHYRDELEVQASQMGGMHPPQEMALLLQKKREQVKQEMIRPQDLDRVERGFQIIMEKVAALPEKELIHKELEAAAANSGEGGELQEKLGLSRATYNTFYSIGLKLWNEGAAEDSLCVFLYLTQLNRLIFEPQLLLGFACQAVKEYELALGAFWNASTLDPKHPEPFFRSAECYSALGEKEKANEILEIIEKEMTDFDRNRLARLKGGA